MLDSTEMQTRYRNLLETKDRQLIHRSAFARESAESLRMKAREWPGDILIALGDLPIIFEVILKVPSAAIIGVTILLSLSACSKHISGHYVCRQDAFQFQPDGTLAT